MQIETRASTSPSPSGDVDDDTTVFIVLGILVPISSFALACICYACLRRREKSQGDEEAKHCTHQLKQHSSAKCDAEKQQQLQQSTASYPDRISHGVPTADLKFIVPHYNTFQSETEGKRCQSPNFVRPVSRLTRHLSSPAAPLHSHAPEVPVNAVLRELRSVDSSPERPSSRASTNEEVHGINVQMYTSESDGDSTANTDSDERVPSQGKLCFNVEIDWLQNQVKVHLKQALRLRSKSMKGSINPSIRVSIHPDPRKTKFHTRPHHSANPQLYETFNFQLPPQAFSEDVTAETSCAETLTHDITHLKDLEIRMALFHCDVFSRKSKVGLITFQPFEISQSSVSTSHPIFRTDGIQVWRDFMDATESSQAQRESQGQVLISLSRDPNKETLSIGILKGKDLNTQHVGFDSAPLLFAKMSLIQGGKVLKSKKTKSTKKQQNPSFNETFRFQMKTSWLEKISVTISICAKNVLGGSKHLGRVTLGPVMYACGASLEHWNDMISAPKSAVAQWHHIY